MPKKKVLRVFWAAAILVGLLGLPSPAAAKEQVQAWEVINPSGTISIQPIKPAPRLASLEGKTIVLRWNGKHNGNNYLDRIAELFAEKLPSTKLMKLYDLDKSTIKISGSNQE